MRVSFLFLTLKGQKETLNLIQISTAFYLQLSYIFSTPLSVEIKLRSEFSVPFWVGKETEILAVNIFYKFFYFIR
jgi:hypothetical protein